MKKKVLTFILTLALIITAIPTAAAFAAGSDKFTDVKSNAWYKSYVDYVVDNGYMVGTSDTKFSPNSRTKFWVDEKRRQV